MPGWDRSASGICGDAELAPASPSLSLLLFRAVHLMTFSFPSEESVVFGRFMVGSPRGRGLGTAMQ